MGPAMASNMPRGFRTSRSWVVERIIMVRVMAATSFMIAVSSKSSKFNSTKSILSVDQMASKFGGRQLHFSQNSGA